MIRLSYPNGVSVRVPKGMSILEASLRNNLPHASVCGGKARCSTCRVRIVGDLSDLPKPSRRERFVLERVGASVDPAVRLACQLRPEKDVAFFLLFPPDVNAARLRRSAGVRVGEERYIVSMFIDMRRSTALAESGCRSTRCSSSIVSSRPFPARSRKLVASRTSSSATASLRCSDSKRTRRPPVGRRYDAVDKIAASVKQLNRDLAGDLHEPIRYGIGVNGGKVIIGDVGYREHVVFTALGDAVNVAAGCRT